MVEMMTVNVGDLRKPGETGPLGESDLLDRMQDGEAICDSTTNGVRLVSLGCFCGTKLSFKKIGRGAETLPFDWSRTRLSAIFHFLQNDFKGFFDWTTRQTVPDTKMTIFRGYYHSFWHDDPTEAAMQERYNRRIERFAEIDARSQTVLFVRAVAQSEELSRGKELLDLLKSLYGPRACLLMIVDFQSTAQGAATIAGIPDLMVYYLSSDVHGANADGAPYTEPVKMGLEWSVGRPIEAMQFVDLETICDCADPTNWGMTGLSNVAAFEDKLPVPRDPKYDTESALMEMLNGAPDASKPITDNIQLVSLGYFCGPKLTFQKMARGAETLPFDWVRCSLDGLIHFMNNDFSDFFDYQTRREVPGSHMVMYRSRYHSFWHDNPDAPDMKEKYRRRITRFFELRKRGRPMLFVRSVACMDELLRADELLKFLTKLFATEGVEVALLMIADFQPETIGSIMVEGHDDLLVYFLGKADRDGGSGSMAPYTTPVQIAIDWMKGEEMNSGCVANFEELRALADSSLGNLANFGAFDAFEPGPTVVAAPAQPAAPAPKAKPAAKMKNMKRTPMEGIAEGFEEEDDETGSTSSSPGASSASTAPCATTATAPQVAVKGERKEGKCGGGVVKMIKSIFTKKTNVD
jgi:hypothetical protein